MSVRNLKSYLLTGVRVEASVRKPKKALLTEAWGVIGILSAICKDSAYLYAMTAARLVSV